MENNNVHSLKEGGICILCGGDLEALAAPLTRICDVCHTNSEADVRCENGHLICNDCLNTTVEEFVKKSCLDYKGEDPIELAVQIMNSPIVRMHGYEHHLIAPAALITCVRNKISRKESLPELIEIIEKRALTEISHDCAFNNSSCGAALGIGMFLEVFNGLDVAAEGESATESSELSALALERIKDHGGPKCCKRDTYFSIYAAIDYLKEKYAIDLPQSEAKCTFSLRNKSCGLTQCQYYNLSNSLV
jgi:hypothetical protein